MVGLIVFGAIALFVGVVWFLDRRRGTQSPSGTRWDDPGQAQAHAFEMLSKLRRGTGGPP
jgi:hypothetical protein